MIDREKLAELHERATKGDLTTAEHHTIQGWFECPFCDGGGEVEASDYCNFDGVALGVQFYGIGQEFGAHEALWAYLVQCVPEILNLIDENKRLREALTSLVTAVCYTDPPKLFNDVLCHEARVPVEFIASARAALENRDD